MEALEEQQEEQRVAQRALFENCVSASEADALRGAMAYILWQCSSDSAESLTDDPAWMYCRCLQEPNQGHPPSGAAAGGKQGRGRVELAVLRQQANYERVTTCSTQVNTYVSVAGAD